MNFSKQPPLTQKALKVKLLQTGCQETLKLSLTLGTSLHAFDFSLGQQSLLFKSFIMENIKHIQSYLPGPSPNFN